MLNCVLVWETVGILGLTDVDNGTINRNRSSTRGVGYLLSKLDQLVKARGKIRRYIVFRIHCWGCCAQIVHSELYCAGETRTLITCPDCASGCPRVSNASKVAICAALRSIFFLRVSEPVL